MSQRGWNITLLPAKVNRTSPEVQGPVHAATKMQNIEVIICATTNTLRL